MQPVQVHLKAGKVRHGDVFLDEQKPANVLAETVDDATDSRLSVHISDFFFPSFSYPPWIFWQRSRPKIHKGRLAVR